MQRITETATALFISKRQTRRHYDLKWLLCVDLIVSIMDIIIYFDFYKIILIFI